MKLNAQVKLLSNDVECSSESVTEVTLWKMRILK